MRVFTPADILLPRVDDMTKWSCIACDQFTAEPEYWREAERIVGSEPSTLRLMLPEAWLGLRDSAAETRKIYAAMKDYVNRGIFRTVEQSFIYVERTLPSGAVRRGLVGKLDLECYDWAPGSATPVRATEGTVESRLPARVEVRRGATLEMPHIMVFINDPGNSIIPSAAGGEALYDFELMLGGGRVRGSRVSGAEAERLSRITEDLLRLTRLDSGVLEKPVEVEVLPVLEQVMRMMSLVAQEKGTDLTYRAEGTCTVLASRDEIHQVIYNLTDNAVKYTPPGSTVQVSLLHQGDQVVLRVEDNGPGIPEGDLPRIFERFYRVDKARSRAAGGTGLGLAIVSDTVSKRGGTVEAANRPGGGAVFTVRWPWREGGGER